MATASAALLDVFAAALAAVHGRACVQNILAANPVCGVQNVVAIGKAAAPMLEGAQTVLGQALRAALLIPKSGHATPTAARIPGVTLIEAGHPLPAQSSLHAGAALLDFIAATPPHAP